MKNLLQRIKRWWVEPFPWGEDCYFCKKEDCRPSYCRSIGLDVDKRKEG